MAFTLKVLICCGMQMKYYATQKRRLTLPVDTAYQLRRLERYQRAFWNVNQSLNSVCVQGNVKNKVTSRVFQQSLLVHANWAKVNRKGEHLLV